MPQVPVKVIVNGLAKKIENAEVTKDCWQDHGVLWGRGYSEPKVSTFSNKILSQWMKFIALHIDCTRWEVWPKARC